MVLAGCSYSVSSHLQMFLCLELREHGVSTALCEPAFCHYRRTPEIPVPKMRCWLCMQRCQLSVLGGSDAEPIDLIVLGACRQAAEHHASWNKAAHLKVSGKQMGGRRSPGPHDGQVSRDLTSSHSALLLRFYHLPRVPVWTQGFQYMTFKKPFKVKL